MQQTEQQKLESLIKQYNNTDSAVIKNNIIKYIDESGHRNQDIADQIGVDIQTIYLYRQPRKQTMVTFENAVKLCNVLEISITKLMEN